MIVLAAFLGKSHETTLEKDLSQCGSDWTKLY